MWWIVILALAIGGYALYKVMQNNSVKEEKKDDETNE